jgi:hypothetical protein
MVSDWTVRVAADLPLNLEKNLFLPGVSGCCPPCPTAQPFCREGPTGNLAKCGINGVPVYGLPPGRLTRSVAVCPRLSSVNTIL